MTVAIDYEWQLRLRLAEKGIYKASELAPLLAERGVRLSDTQIWRLITGRPERMNLGVLAVLCDILSCSPNDLIAVTVGRAQASLEKAAGDHALGDLKPAPARIRQSTRDRRA